MGLGFGIRMTPVENLRLANSRKEKGSQTQFLNLDLFPRNSMAEFAGNPVSQKVRFLFLIERFFRNRVCHGSKGRVTGNTKGRQSTFGSLGNLVDKNPVEGIMKGFGV